MGIRLVHDPIDWRTRNGSCRRTSNGIHVTETGADILRGLFLDSEKEAERNRSVRRFMETSGPFLAALGRYLSSRIDLLPYSLCQELATIPDIAPPSPPEAARQIFIQETGITPDTAFLYFNSSPFESRLFWQSYRATLASVDLDVRIIHPRISEWGRDAEGLGSLEVAFAACGTKETHFREAVADFQSGLVACENFDSDLRAFGLLARDAQSFGPLAVPQVYRHLTTPRVLVCEHSGALGESAKVPSPEHARMVCFTWLRQALLGLVYPVEPSTSNVAVSPEGRILFTAGPFATLPDKMKSHLLNYLTAVAAQDADKAYTHFARLVSLRHTGSAEEELRRQFLQMCASRDGFASVRTLGAKGTYSGFTEEVLIHWRIAQKLASIDSDLIAFYRGFLHVAGIAAALANERDSLLEALFDLRLLSVFDEAKDLIRPTEMAGLLERYATAALGMPEQMDRLLTALTSEKLRIDDHGLQPGTRPVRRDHYVTAISLLLAWAAVVVLLQKVEESARSPGLRYAVIILCVGLGLMLLRFGSKL